MSFVAMDITETRDVFSSISSLVLCSWNSNKRKQTMQILCDNTHESLEFLM